MSTVLVEKNRCKGCGLCVSACPSHVLAMSQEINAKGYFFPMVDHPEDCNGCRYCVLVCPDVAVQVEHKGKTSERPEALNDMPMHYCPGCTHGVIHRLVAEAIDALEIRERATGDKVRLGVSGHVYSTGRKGEGLAARLAGDFEGKAEMVAFGMGWPLKILSNDLTKRAWYYNSLDAFVCTSLIEGVPMPPLEALACGVPVVIPRNVGMLDSLPHMTGIYRYKAGDYDDLRHACERAEGRRQAERFVEGGEHEAVNKQHRGARAKQVFNKNEASGCRVFRRLFHVRILLSSRISYRRPCIRPVRVEGSILLQRQ